MSGINGVLLETGFGNVLEFIFGVLFGLVAVSVFAVIVAGFIGLAGGIPTSAVAILFGAVLALWYLSENTLTELMRGLFDTDNWSWPFVIPDALSVLPLVSIVLAVASLSGLAAMFVGKSMRRLYPRFRIGLWLFTIGITGIAIAVVLRRPVSERWCVTQCCCWCREAAGSGGQRFIFVRAPDLWCGHEPATAGIRCRA
jgi:hypothetical protein